MLNWIATDTCEYVDQKNKMMIAKNPNWNPNATNGKGDAIGRTAIAYYNYRDPRFIEGIESCWRKVERKGIKRLLFGKYYYQGYRYPEYYPGQDGLSRDHLFYTVLAYKIAGKTDKEIWEFVSHLRWKISDFAMMTIDLKLWLNAVSGRKFAKWLSPRLTYIVLKFNVWKQKKIQNFSGIGPDFEENQDTFRFMMNSDKPKIIDKVCSLLFPTYALHQLAWQSCFYEGRWKKKIQDKIYSITPKYNYAIKLLVEHPEGITKEDIMSYKPMIGGRWSGNMNKWWNDRTLEIVTDEECIKYNVEDVDYLRKLWDENGKNS